MLGRLSVRTKLVLGFLLVLTFLAVSGVMAADRLRTMGDLAADLYDQPLQAADFARMAQIDIRDLTSAWRLAGHPDPALAGQAQADYRRARQGLDRAVPAARRWATSPSVADRLARVLEQLGRWDRLVPPELVSPTDTAELEALAGDIRADIDRAAEDARADGAASADNARRIAAEARWRTLTVSLILVVGGLLVSVVLAADIIRPLRTAVAVSEAVAGGDLDRTVAVRRRDETGRLLSAVDLIRRRLRDHEEADRVRTEIMIELARIAARSLKSLRATQAQLVEAERMAALGGLVAGVAHEINTPLGNALGASSHLLHRTREAKALLNGGKLRKSDAEAYFATADEAALIINTNLDRAGELVHSFKQVAVDQTSDLCRRFDLAAYIDDVLTSLKPRLKKGAHRVTVDCPDGLELQQFAGGLAQVLTNLIINALTHAFDGITTGTIAITARTRDPDGVELVVADDGCGISPETVGRIFEPFFTTRRGSGGSGLGLHIVHDIVTQRLGGTIAVDSTVGAGTRFVLLFPQRAPATAGEPDHG